MEVSLKEYVEALMKAHHLIDDKRFEALETLVEAKEKGLREALSVAKQNEDRWRDSANEWRAAMTDREMNFFPRAMGYMVGGIAIVSFLFSVFSYISR